MLDRHADFPNIIIGAGFSGEVFVGKSLKEEEGEGFNVASVYVAGYALLLLHDRLSEL